MLFANNILLQVCALLSIIFTGIFLIGSFIPALDFEREIPNPGVVRVIVLIVLLGSIRGAF